MSFSLSSSRMFLIILLMLPLSAFAKLKVEAYGYVKLDVQYNSKNTGSFPSPPPSFVPLNTDKADQHGETIVDARETRLGIKASDEFREKIKMLGVIEGDFFTGNGDALNSNSRHFRLRLAYLDAKLHTGLFLLAGQNWSSFMNSQVAQPTLIDFNGPVGAIFAREPQFLVGYGKHLGEKRGKLVFQAAIEKQSFNTLGITNPSTEADTAQGSGQNWPLLVTKISWLLKNFQIEVAICGSQNVVVLNDQGQEKKKDVWGIQSSAQYVHDKLTLYTSLHRLYGVTRLDGGNYPDMVIDTHKHLHPVACNGFYVGGAWAFSKKTSLNTVYGWELAHSIPHTSFTGDAYSKYQSFHINVIHQFWKRWQAGIEYQRFWNQACNGTRGNVNIYHFGIYYFF